MFYCRHNRWERSIEINLDHTDDVNEVSHGVPPRCGGGSRSQSLSAKTFLYLHGVGLDSVNIDSELSEAEDAVDNDKPGPVMNIL